MIEVSVWRLGEFKHYSYDMSKPAYTVEPKHVDMGKVLVNPKLISTAKHGFKTSCDIQLVKVCVGSETIFVALVDFNKLMEAS